MFQMNFMFVVVVAVVVLIAVDVQCYWLNLFLLNVASAFVLSFILKGILSDPYESLQGSITS